MKTNILLSIMLLAAMLASFNSDAQNTNVTLGGMSNGQVTAAQLAADSVLRASEPDMTVISFRMSKYEKDKDAVEIESSTSQLTPSMHQAIAQSAPGTKIYFEYIKGKSGKGYTIALSPMEFVIK
jgi:hypothetical protein